MIFPIMFSERGIDVESCSLSVEQTSSATMPKGVKIVDHVIGSGAEAKRGSVVAAHVRIFLNRGNEVSAEHPEEPRTMIDLGRRNTIAGLRYGIEGMREGGKRSLLISPHLAYGEEGMGERIPPRAVLRCEVELLEVLPDGARSTESCGAAGPQLCVFSSGEAAKGVPRVQIHVHGNSVGAFVTRPIPGHGWRRAPSTYVEIETDPVVPPGELLAEALALPRQSPECLSEGMLWSDLSESGNGILRDLETDTPCVSVTVNEGVEQLASYSLRIDSAVWLKSGMCRLRNQVLEWVNGTGDQTRAEDE